MKSHERLSHMELFLKGSHIYGPRGKTGGEGQLIERGKCPSQAYGGTSSWRGLCPANKWGHGQSRQSAQLRFSSENSSALAVPLGWAGQGTSQQTCWPRLSLKDDTGCVSLSHPSGRLFGTAGGMMQAAQRRAWFSPGPTCGGGVGYAE